MKKHFRVIALLGLAAISLPMLAQTKEPPAKDPTVKELQVQLAMKDIQTSLADYQMTVVQINTEAEKHLAPLRDAVTQAVEKARELRGLDASYDYDPTKKDFVKKPVPQAHPVTPQVPAPDSTNNPNGPVPHSKPVEAPQKPKTP